MTAALAAPETVKWTYREACKQGIRDALNRDPKVFLMGADVGAYGGCFAVTKGLLQEYGRERIRDCPLCESTYTGIALGAAMNGMRPICEVMTVNFSLLALDQIMNNAATLLHMSGGQFNVPIVIRMATGAGRQLAAQHAHALEGWYAHIPGIKVLVPGTVEDARGMLWPALEDPDPVIIFEHQIMYNMEETITLPVNVDIEHAKVRRPGTDITVLTYGASLPKAMEAA
ncbi:MAG TPA: alpha-ketoacid dehydrogenase subunit beta, partial [Anaerolineales bacterium]